MMYVYSTIVSSPLTALKEQMRDGTQTATMAYTVPGNGETETQKNTRKTNNLNTARGLQESWESYDQCYIRERNQGMEINHSSSEIEKC